MADIDIEKLEGIRHIYAPGIEPRKEDADLSFLASALDGPGPTIVLLVLGVFVLGVIIRRFVAMSQLRRAKHGFMERQDREQRRMDEQRARMRALRQTRQRGNIA